MRVNDEPLGCRADTMEGVTGYQRKFRPIVNRQHLYVVGRDDLGCVHNIQVPCALIGDDDIQALADMFQRAESLSRWPAYCCVTEAAEGGRSLEEAGSPFQVQEGAPESTGTLICSDGMRSTPVTPNEGEDCGWIASTFLNKGIESARCWADPCARSETAHTLVHNAAETHNIFSTQPDFHPLECRTLTSCSARACRERHRERTQQECLQAGCSPRSEEDVLRTNRHHQRWRQDVVFQVWLQGPTELGRDAV